MFKQLLSDNRLFIPAVCLLVFIAGGLIYLIVVKSHARRDVQRTQKIVAQRSNPQTGEIEPQPAPGGHYHADGTYHVGSHEPPQTTGSPPTLPAGATGKTAQMPLHTTGTVTEARQRVPQQPSETAAEPKPLTPAEEAELKALDEQWKADERTRDAINAGVKASSEKVSAYFAEANALRNKPGRTPADEVRIGELGQLMKKESEITQQLALQGRQLTESQKERRLRYRELVNRKTQAGTTASEGRK